MLDQQTEVAPLRRRRKQAQCCVPEPAAKRARHLGDAIGSARHPEDGFHPWAPSRLECLERGRYIALVGELRNEHDGILDRLRRTLSNPGVTA
jgi:hypothetical protein